MGYHQLMEALAVEKKLRDQSALIFAYKHPWQSAKGIV